MIPRQGPPRGDQTWRTFVRNHASEVWACDFLTQYTALLAVAYILVIMVRVRHRRSTGSRIRIRNCGSLNLDAEGSMLYPSRPASCTTTASWPEGHSARGPQILVRISATAPNGPGSPIPCLLLSRESGLKQPRSQSQ